VSNDNHNFLVGAVILLAISVILQGWIGCMHTNRLDRLEERLEERECQPRGGEAERISGSTSPVCVWRARLRTTVPRGQDRPPRGF